MTPDEFRELLEKATPEPWEDWGVILHLRKWDAEGEDWDSIESNDTDEHLVAMLRNLAPKLLALWEGGKRLEQHGVVDQLFKALDELEEA